MKKLLLIVLLFITSVFCIKAQDDRRAGKADVRANWYSVQDLIRDSVYYKKSAAGRIKKMHMDNAGAQILLPEKTGIQKQIDSIDSMRPKNEEITVVDDKGNKEIIMRAIRDEESGDMVANEVLEAAVVTARFRNVAERHGYVDLEFDIIVPRELYDSHWQLRFNPRMSKMGQETDLAPVVITGNEYRKAQLKGYQQYNRFLESIITDPTKFVDMNNLEIFIRRNLPMIYYFKTDSTEVSDEVFRSCFGVTEKQAIDHYTSQRKIRMNKRRIDAREKMFHRYVKAPIDTVGIRLDTVMVDYDGNFVYEYVQTVKTEKNLKKVEIALSGSIYEQDRKLYSIPQTAPLDFYISSLAAFVDETPHYLMKVIERRAEANTAYNIDFEVSKANIVPGLRNNASEIERIKDNLASLMKNEVFDLDSISVTAFASPEGTVAANRALSVRRADAVSAYFNQYIRHYQDSLRADAGVMIDLSGDSETMRSNYQGSDIRFISHIGGENWKQLAQELELTDLIPEEEKVLYLDLFEVGNLDDREARMRRLPSYNIVKNELYPSCRTVQFNFFLHRKGMVKDTVHTTVLDENYMAGVQAIKDRDYEKAIAILRPYQDYNAAVAFVAMDYNLSAMSILEDLPKTDQVEYLKAIIYARQGDDQNAVQCFMNAYSKDPTYLNRGNLDPEIRAIIRRYKLDEQEDEFQYDF